MAPSSRSQKSRSRAGARKAVDKSEQAETTVSAFPVVRVCDIPADQQEQKRKVPPASIHFKIIEEEKSLSGYTELWAYSGDDTVGYAFLEERPKGELYIELVLTFPAYRQQGVGSALVQEVERYGRSRGCRRLTGEVSANDYTTLPAEIAQRAHWFEALGFKARKVAEHRWTLAKAL